jgi:hypothetical protein
MRFGHMSSLWSQIITNKCVARRVWIQLIQSNHNQGDLTYSLTITLINSKIFLLNRSKSSINWETSLKVSLKTHKPQRNKMNQRELNHSKTISCYNHNMKENKSIGKRCCTKKSTNSTNNRKSSQKRTYRN